jgi:PmbA protein
VTTSRFSLSDAALKQIAQDILHQAKANGATAAEADVSQGFGQHVTVRLGEVETIEYTRDKGLSVTVYFDKKRGNASTSDLSQQAIADTVKAACSIARYTAADEFSGLPEEALLFKGPLPELDLYHPWSLSVEDAIEQATRCEAAALAVDKRINNSEGGTVNTQESSFVYANSLGFINGYSGSRYDISAAVIAEDNDMMQRDYWYSSARDPNDLESVASVGKRAGERTIARLNARKIGTMQVPVLFEASIASGLIGSFVGAVSGGSLYRKSSFLLDSLGKQIFSPMVQLRESPFIKKGLASGAFDSEGVATRERDVIKDGVLQGYFLSTYSSRKLGMQTTGNAGGSHNLILQSGDLDFKGLLKKMGTGLVVTELLGQGVNMVTGDYSRGAAGYWVKNGEIQHAVEEITIAGNLKDMFKQIIEVGNDVVVRGSKQCGSILIERMTVAGD